MSQPQTEAKPNQKPASDVIEQHMLSGLVLREATRFNHSDSVNTSNGIAIVAARLTATGDWTPATGNERIDGFGLLQLRGAGKDRRLVRAFVPLANVKECIYSE